MKVQHLLVHNDIFSRLKRAELRDVIVLIRFQKILTFIPFRVSEVTRR